MLGGRAGRAAIAIGAFILYDALKDDSPSAKQVTLLDFTEQADRPGQAGSHGAGPGPGRGPAGERRRRRRDRVRARTRPPAPEGRQAARQVKLTFNKGRPRSICPTSSASTSRRPTARLHALGLTADVTEQESRRPARRAPCWPRDPAPGKVDAGSTVKLTVSKGVGPGRRAQRGQPRRGDGHVAAVERRPHGDAGAGGERAASTPARVIRTDPPAGQVVDKGTPVTIVVSSGPPQVGVPK